MPVGNPPHMRGDALDGVSGPLGAHSVAADAERARATHGGLSQSRPMSANCRRIRRRSQTWIKWFPLATARRPSSGLKHIQVIGRGSGAVRSARVRSGRGVDQAHQLGGKSDRQRAAIRAEGDGAGARSAIAEQPPGGLPRADLPGTIIDFRADDQQTTIRAEGNIGVGASQVLRKLPGPDIPDLGPRRPVPRAGRNPSAIRADRGSVDVGVGAQLDATIRGMLGEDQESPLAARIGNDENVRRATDGSAIAGRPA